MLRLLMGLSFVFVLGLAGWSVGESLGGRQQAQLFAFAGVFLAGMILVVATRSRGL